MKWLAPLILLVILLILGALFCTKHPEPPVDKPPANVNANANKAIANNTAVVVNSNTNMPANGNAAGNANTNAPANY